MHDQGISQPIPQNHPSLSFVKQFLQTYVFIHSKILESPLAQDQKEQFFKESKLTVSFSSPPNSGRENCIPDEEVISCFIPDDNHSQTSYKQVRFSEPQEKTTNTIGFKFRRQRSIPIPEKVQEDPIGESSQLSPYNKSQIRIKERQHMNQSTNLLNDNDNQFTISASQLENSFGLKTISSNDQFDQITQMADQLVILVKNYLNDIQYHERHFTFDEREIDNRNILQIQRRVLKKALEKLNHKLNSPISIRSNSSSSCLNDINVEYKELLLKIEELEGQNEILKDKLDIQDFVLLKQYEQVKELKIQLVDLEMKNTSFQLDLDNKDKEIVNQNEQLLKLKKQLDDQIKICQNQSQKIQLLEQQQQQQQQQSQQQQQQQIIEKQTNSYYYSSQKTNNNINKSFKKEKKHTNSFHEVCSSPNGKKIMIVNSSTNSSQQSPRNLQISNSKTLNLDDTTYFGSVYNEKRQGYGNLKKGDKKLYMGFWKDDTFNGFGHLNNETVDFGIIDYRNLDSVGNKWINYQGEFQDGLFHGYGIWTFSDNSRFHGVFQLGKACGRGAYYTNINTIQGIWNKNIKM